MEFDEGVLETVVQRKDVLAVLAEGPHHRSELQEELAVSKATCHRIIRTFEEHELVQRTDEGYELTELGRVVSDRVREFEETVRTAQQLEPLLEGIAASGVGYDVELFTDARIVRARPNDPYPPVERFIQLFRESDTLRNFGPTPVPPTMVSEVFDLLFSEEKRIEMIKPHSVVSKYVDEFDDDGRKAATRDQLGVRIHEDLPVGMSLFDDDVGLRGYDLDTGTILLFAETDDPDAIAWAERVFNQYREEPKPLSQFDEFPAWAQEGLTLTIE